MFHSILPYFISSPSLSYFPAAFRIFAPTKIQIIYGYEQHHYSRNSQRETHGRVNRPTYLPLESLGPGQPSFPDGRRHPASDATGRRGFALHRYVTGGLQSARRTGRLHGDPSPEDRDALPCPCLFRTRIRQTVGAPRLRPLGRPLRRCE